MDYITTNDEFTAIIPIPGSSSGDTVNYTIYTSDGSTFASGSATHVAGIFWKVTFTPTTDGETYIVSVDDTTIDSQRENIYISTGVVVSGASAPGGEDLTTLAAFKTEFNVSTSTHDTLLTRLVSDMSKWCQEYTNRDLVSKTYNGETKNEIYDGEGGNVLCLRQYPVTSLVSVWDDLDRDYESADLIASADIHLKAEAGIIVLDNGVVFQEGIGNVKVSYVAGYTTIPGDLEYACQCLIMASYLEKIGSINEVVGDQVIYKPAKLRREAKDVLERYKSK